MGRPKKILTEEQIRIVERLAEIGCTQEEISYILDIEPNTLRARFKDQPEVFTAYQKGLAKLKKRIRELQLKAAERGSAAILIWLGKQYLGQVDKQEVYQTSDSQVKLVEVVLTDESKAS